ncbi:hypothetical protein ACLB2K_074290 [Fragaria x ananassa]
MKFSVSRTSSLCVFWDCKKGSLQGKHHLFPNYCFLAYISPKLFGRTTELKINFNKMSLFLSSTATICSFLYMKVSELLANAKNYIVNKARGYVLARLVEMQRRSAFIIGLQLEDMSFDSMDLLFKISVFNSFLFSLPVSQASFKMKISGSEPISGKLKEPVYMKAGAESILSVLAKVPYSMPINLANDISVDKNIDYRIDLQLTIHLPIIGNISLPLPCQQGEAKISELFSNLMDQIMLSW